MRHSLFLGTYDVAFEYLGLGDGLNFSRQFAPDEAAANVQKMRRLHGATLSARIIPKENYDVCVSPATGDVDIACAALITAAPNDALVLLPADCIPIVLAANAQTPACALIHAGRRELDSGIIERTVLQLNKQFQIEPGQLVAYLGPGIKQRSYRLPGSIANTLQHPNWGPFITTDNDIILLDTFGFARAELERAGVPSAAITESDIDTVTDPGYYSYYGRTRLGQPAGTNGCALTLSLRT